MTKEQELQKLASVVVNEYCIAFEKGFNKPVTTMGTITNALKLQSSIKEMLVELWKIVHKVNDYNTVELCTIYNQTKDEYTFKVSPKYMSRDDESEPDYCFTFITV